jgi:hypothetical protein
MPSLAEIDYEIWSIGLISIYSMLVRIFLLKPLFPIAWAMPVRVLDRLRRELVQLGGIDGKGGGGGSSPVPP